jgi:Rad3-related DNA helicase
MNKVLQAAGRVIRTADDVGAVGLLDERFVTPAYRRLFPLEWDNARETTSAELPELLEKFWNEWL